jgi:ABC-type multidrug transport system fused ATPase/permease subunit
LIDLYDNYKTIEACKKSSDFCYSMPNPCCRYKNLDLNKPCGDSDCLYWTENYWDWDKPGLLRFFVFMTLQFIFHSFVLFLYESDFIINIKYYLEYSKLKNKSLANTKNYNSERNKTDLKKDSDVILEEKRIENLKILDTNEKLIVKGLKKYYNKYESVRGISFTLAHQECFGLIGINGAGKTTTFKMITGNECMTDGEIFLNNLNIKKDLSKVNCFFPYILLKYI